MMMDDKVANEQLYQDTDGKVWKVIKVVRTATVVELMEIDSACPTSPVIRTFKVGDDEANRLKMLVPECDELKEKDND